MAAVMTITDGKPSFLFQTNEKGLQLKDKHTKLFFCANYRVQGCGAQADEEVGKLALGDEPCARSWIGGLGRGPRTLCAKVLGQILSRGDVTGVHVHRGEDS